MAVYHSEPLMSLIPRTVLFGNPERTLVRVSPDGTTLAWLAPLDGVLNVFVQPIDQSAIPKPVTNDTGRGTRSYQWAKTSAHLLFIQDKDGDENWHVYSVDLDTKETINLTPFENVASRVPWRVPETFSLVACNAMVERSSP